MVLFVEEWKVFVLSQNSEPSISTFTRTTTMDSTPASIPDNVIDDIQEVLVKLATILEVSHRLAAQACVLIRTAKADAAANQAAPTTPTPAPASLFLQVPDGNASPTSRPLLRHRASDLQVSTSRCGLILSDTPLAQESCAQTKRSTDRLR